MPYILPSFYTYRMIRRENMTISLKSIILLALVMEMRCVSCGVGSGIVYYLDDFQASSECQVKQNSEIELRIHAAPFVM